MPPNQPPVERARRALDRVLQRAKPATLGWQKSDSEIVIAAPGGIGRVYITWRQSGTRDIAANRRGVPLAGNLPILVVPGSPNVIVDMDSSDRAALAAALPDANGVYPHTHNHSQLANLNVFDDHPRYLDAERGDLRYFLKGEHVAVSAGAADAGKPVVLGVAGKFDATLIPAGGAPGDFGGNTLAYRFSSAIADADPGAGALRFNNATFAAITQLYVDDLDDGGADAQAWLATLDDSTNAQKGYVRVANKADSSIYRIFGVSGTLTEATGYWKVPVTPVVQNGVLNDTDAVTVSFVRSGDVGATGPQGPPGDAADMVAEIDAAAELDPPDDAMRFAATLAGALRWVSWANLKSALTTLFNGLYVGLTGDQAVSGIKRFVSNMIVGLDEVPAARLDVRGSSLKAATAAVEYLLYLASTDAVDPLTLRAGVVTHATPASRYAVIEVDDGGVKRPLVIQPSGGVVGINTFPIADALLQVQLSTAGADTEANYAINKNGGYGFLVGFKENKINNFGHTGTFSVGYLRNVTTDPFFMVVNNVNVSQSWLSDGSVFIGGVITGFTGAGARLLVLNSGVYAHVGATGNHTAVGGPLYTSATGAANVGTGEDDLAAYTVPGSTLSVNTQSLWLEASGNVSPTGATKTLRVRFGTSLLFSYAFGPSTGYAWTLRGRIVRAGPSTQRAHMTLCANLLVATSTTGAAETLTSNLVFKVTGEATLNSDITLDTFVVGFHPANV